MSRRKEDRDDAILQHLGQYGLSLRPVVAHCFFGGGNPGNVLQRLVKTGKVVAHDQLPQKRSYYQLSSSEAAARSFPASRADALDGANLDRRLAILWFCTMGKHQRQGLLPQDIYGMLERKMPNAAHCIEQPVRGRQRLLRMKVISPDLQPSEVVDWVRKTIKKDRGHTIHQEWIESRQYGYAILVDDPTEDQARVAAVLDGIKQSGLYNDIHVPVEFAPSAATLTIALKSFVKK